MQEACMFTGMVKKYETHQNSEQIDLWLNKKVDKHSAS